MDTERITKEIAESQDQPQIEDLVIHCMDIAGIDYFMYDLYISEKFEFIVLHSALLDGTEDTIYSVSVLSKFGDDVLSTKISVFDNDIIIIDASSSREPNTDPSVYDSIRGEVVDRSEVEDLINYIVLELI